MEAVQEKTKSQISTVTRQYFKPFYALHWHYNYEICQVIDNEIDFLINGVLVEAKAGDVVIIEENVVHQFLATYGKTNVRIIQVSPKILLEAAIPIKGCRMHIPAEEMAEIPGFAQQLKILLEIIEDEGNVSNHEDNDYQKCLVSALYCLLIRYFAEERTNKELSDSQKDFRRILKYVNTHYEENINVKILAEQFFMYRGRVSALFMKYSNMSLNEYVSSVRIKKANELIEQGSSIIEAALQSGFQNVRTFNRVYKKTMGVSPREHKKQMEEQTEGESL